MNALNKQLNIRAYGPGKYNWVVDQYVHHLSLIDYEEVLSFPSGSSTLVKGPLYIESVDSEPPMVELNEDEIYFLNRFEAGAIVHEDDMGFVVVHMFGTEDALMIAWEAVVRDYRILMENYDA